MTQIILLMPILHCILQNSKNAWIGLFVNAPNYAKGEKLNARLYVLPKSQIQNVPAYRHILRNPLLLIEVTDEIQPNTEILNDSMKVMNKKDYI